MPASTSPLPAVASQGVPLSLTPSRPSGAAMTVAAPFSTTTAPARPAASAAAASRPCSSRPGNRRRNSPSCGVSTSSRSRASNRSPGQPSNTVRPSASTTRAAPVPARARTLARVASLTPAAGPMTTASRLAAASARASSELNGVSMIASIAGAMIAVASGGHRIRTTPAPIRRPARAASRAAPVWLAFPDTTPSRPRACLCVSTPGQGMAARQSGRAGRVIPAYLRSRMARPDEKHLPYCAMQCPLAIQVCGSKQPAWDRR